MQGITPQWVTALDGDYVAVVAVLALGDFSHLAFDVVAIEEAEEEHDQEAEQEAEYLKAGPR